MCFKTTSDDLQPPSIILVGLLLFSACKYCINPGYITLAQEDGRSSPLALPESEPDISKYILKYLGSCCDTLGVC